MKGRKFALILSHDLRVGLVYKLGLFLVVIPLVLLGLLEFQQMVQAGKEAGMLMSTPSVEEGYIYLMKGMKEYHPERDEYFKIPILWLCFHLYLAFLTGGYPYDDLHGFGQKVMLQSRGRGCWWISKCIWSMGCVTLYYMLTAFIVGVFGIFNSWEVGGISGDIGQMILEMENIWQGGSILRFYLMALFLPWLSSISLALLQNFLMILSKPIYAYMAVAAILIASAYWKNPFLIGNGSMLLRSQLFVAEGLESKGIVCVYMVIILLSVAGGGWFMRRCNILDKEDV